MAKRETTTGDVARMVRSLVEGDHVSPDQHELDGREPVREGLAGELLAPVTVTHHKVPGAGHRYRVTVGDGDYRTGGAWDVTVTGAGKRDADLSDIAATLADVAEILAERVNEASRARALVRVQHALRLANIMQAS